MADSSSTRLMQLVILCPSSYPIEKPPLQLLCLVVSLMHSLVIYTFPSLCWENNGYRTCLLQQANHWNVHVVSSMTQGTLSVQEDQPRTSSTKGYWWNNSAVADPVLRLPASMNSQPGASHTSILFSFRNGVRVLQLDLWTCFLRKGSD